MQTEVFVSEKFSLYSLYFLESFSLAYQFFSNIINLDSFNLFLMCFSFYNFKGKTVSDGRAGSPDSISSLGSSASQKQPQSQQMQPGVPPPTSMYPNQPQPVYAPSQNPQHGQGVSPHTHYFQGSGAGGRHRLLKVNLLFYSEVLYSKRNIVHIKIVSTTCFKEIC